MFLTIITFLIVLSLLVFAHEIGHFWTARRFGVKAEEFGFGFPPRIVGFQLIKNQPQIIEETEIEIVATEEQAIVSETVTETIVNNKRKKNGRWRLIWGGRSLNGEEAQGDTVYSINWIPLGGFVKIKGENGEVKGGDSFANKKIWQRAIILSAGVLMNIVLAAVILTAGLMIGLPQILDNLPDNVQVSSRMIQIVDVLPNSPAARADFKLGDVIVDIDDEQFAQYADLQNFVDQRQGQALTYTIKRGQELLDKQAVPEVIKETGRGGIGIGIAEVGLVRYPWYAAIVQGFKSTVLLLGAIIVGFISLLGRIFSGHNVAAEVAGPVGIATLTGQMVEMGWVYVLQFTAILSLNLAVINILPIPALDGGRLLFLIIEKIKGQPVKQTIEAMVHNIFFIILLLLILLITFKDVAKLGCWTCQLKAIFNLW